MAQTNKVTANMAGGEVSPLVHGRIDLPLFQKSMAKILNWLVLTQGCVRFRNGFHFVRYTRLNQKAVFIPFQFSDQQSYLIEATDKKFRFYKDEGIITLAPQALTGGGISNANPGTVNLVAHGYANGDEVFITGIKGMPEINDQFYLVANAAADTFTLTDIFGTDIDTTNFGTYVSGGTVAKVYEIDTPFRERDLAFLQYTQNADTMYSANQRYEPRKITRSGHAAWACATYVRTSDPFVPSAKAITGVTNAAPGVVTSVAHGFVTGNEVAITGVTGMIELNFNFYTVVVINANSFSLVDLDGVAVDTSGFTAYAANGTATRTNSWPGACTFIDSARLMFAGTQANPETAWASKSPASGATAFDNFTTGTNATDALIFTLAPIHGKVDAIQSLTSTSKFIVALTFGAIRRLYGSTEQEPISPTSVTAKSVNAVGCARSIPISNGDSLFYIQRGGKIVRSLEYDFSIDSYVTTDRNLVAEHISKPGLLQLVEQIGIPDIIWGVRNDGRLVGVTHKEKEDISGWHQHYLGGQHVNANGVTRNNAKLLWLGVMPRPQNTDQLWAIVERVINGNTVRSVEFMADEPDYPERSDYNYSGEATADVTQKEADDKLHTNALYEVQKGACHLDMSTVFDGADLTAGVTLSFDGAMTVTTSADFFDATMIGNEIWKKYDINGNGGGRYQVTAIVDTKNATVKELVAFDTNADIAGGNWMLTANIITGLHYLEGETVQVIVDGGQPVSTDNDFVVANGQIDIGYQISKCIVGYKYRGELRSLDTDTGGISGPAQSKPRTVFDLALRLRNALGISIGTNPYDLTRLEFKKGFHSDRPTPLFTGMLHQSYTDSWEDAKELYIIQNAPLPCTVLNYDAYVDTTDE